LRLKWRSFRAGPFEVDDDRGFVRENRESTADRSLKAPHPVCKCHTPSWHHAGILGAVVLFFSRNYQKRFSDQRRSPSETDVTIMFTSKISVSEFPHRNQPSHSRRAPEQASSRDGRHLEQMDIQTKICFRERPSQFAAA
jgi:hypothetical protein